MRGFGITALGLLITGVSMGHTNQGETTVITMVSPREQNTQRLNIYKNVIILPDEQSITITKLLKIPIYGEDPI